MRSRWTGASRDRAGYVAFLASKLANVLSILQFYPKLRSYACNRKKQVMVVRVQRAELRPLLVRGQVERLAPEVEEELAGARGRVVRGRRHVDKGLDRREGPAEHAHLARRALPVLHLHVHHRLCAATALHLSITPVAGGLHQLSANFVQHQQYGPQRCLCACSFPVPSGPPGCMKGRADDRMDAIENIANIREVTTCPHCSWSIADNFTKTEQHHW